MFRSLISAVELAIIGTRTEDRISSSSSIPFFQNRQSNENLKSLYFSCPNSYRLSPPTTVRASRTSRDCKRPISKEAGLWGLLDGPLKSALSSFWILEAESLEKGDHHAQVATYSAPYSRSREDRGVL